jgi:chromosome segregation ATPase
VNAGGHNDVLSSELKKLREQLVATREERDTLFKEAARLAAAHTELEVNKAECIAVKDSSIAEALTRVEAVEKELQLKNVEVEELKRRTAESEVDKQALEYEVQRLQEKIGASAKLLVKATQEIEAFINRLAVADSDLARTQQVITDQHQRMAVDKDQIQQLKARVAVIDRELEVAALVSELDVICSRICDYL